jgi:YVTN family beta-propeller protein
MHFRVLGPLQVVDEDGRSLVLGGPKQRALLALLLMEANRPLSKDRLIDALWGEHAPVSSSETVDTYISRLRRILGPDRLTRRPAGYELRVDAGELDLSTFDALVSEAEQLLHRDPAAAAAIFRRALALWNGDPMGDLRYELSMTGITDQLAERHLAALERQAEADLVAGNGPELVPQLELLARDHPTRERLVAHLMLALYRAGRQSDALAAMQSCRRHLSRELGLEPGPELRRLEQRILEHDEGLVPPSAPPPPQIPSPVTSVDGYQPSRSKRRWAVPAAVLVTVALVVSLLTALGQGASPAVAADANTLVAINDRSNLPAMRVELPVPPGAIAAAGGSMWVASPSGGAVLEVDSKEGSVSDRIPVDGEPGSLVSGAGALWVAGTMGGTAERIDPDSAVVTWTTHLPETGPAAMAYGDGGLWVADATDQAVVELSPLSGSVLRTFSLDVHPSSIALADGLVWVAAYSAGTVEVIEPWTGQAVGTVNVGNGPSAISFIDGDLWVANSLDSTVSVVDPATFTVVSTIAVGSGPSALAAADGAVWVANQYSGTVSRISPTRLAVVATVDVGNDPIALTSGRGVIWVAASAPAGDDKGGALRLVSTAGFISIDPATFGGLTPLSFLRLEYDTLVTFDPVPGPNGLRLVPDLALQVPSPTDGGRTYSFRLRPGIRYSDGQLVRAGDFRRGVERLFELSSPGAADYSGLVGAQACVAALENFENCNLSQGVVTNDRSGLVIFHLTAPDPDFLDKITPEAYGAPIPPGTPDTDMGLSPLPGTGPYRIAMAKSGEVVFRRNPYFREWSHAAQPEGNPNVIIWRTLPSEQALVNEIAQGKADWTWGSIPPPSLRALEVEDPSEVQSGPSFVVEFIPLNTNRPPFNNVLARRALNYAIDRRKIAEMYGGPTVATPTCQPLLPGLLGYKRYCPYTMHPTPSGAWTAPDLVLAKKLVDESGTKGDVVTVLGSPDEGTIPSQEAAYITHVLGYLGYRARLKMVPFNLVGPGEIQEMQLQEVQLSVEGDLNPEYPAPSSYVPSFFACDGGNTGYIGSHSNANYCNPAIDLEMQQATLLENQSPVQAAVMWARVDRQLTDQAEWVATVDLNQVDIISKQLRNYEFNPVWGFVADQAVVN